jgi:hypothetical protein
MLVITTTDLINTSFVQWSRFSYKTTVKVHLSLLLVLNKKNGPKKGIRNWGAVILLSILINWLLLIWIC